LIRQVVSNGTPTIHSVVADKVRREKALDLGGCNSCPVAEAATSGFDLLKPGVFS
jgi:hypothetical protein